MLLPCDRLTPLDIATWEQRVRADAVYSTLKSFQRKQDTALEVARAYATASQCYASISWGKDSMVIAHLAIRLRVEFGIVVPLAWVRVEPIKNPHCTLVRDAFFQKYDHPYYESEVWCRRDDDGWHARGTLERGFVDLESRIGTKRSLRGIRGAESGIRKSLIDMHGLTSKNSCRPIGRWSGQDVFAYLYQHNLPIHPAYAMSMGGILDRDRIRVSSIGGKRGTGMGRDAWEAKYYGDELADVFGGSELVDQLT